MQQITITGYLSRDAEVRTTQNGDSIANWNVPVKQGFGEREKTNWFRVSIWGKRAEYAGKARKGEFVTVTGELTIGEYDGKPQYEIRAVDFQSVRTAPKGEVDQPSTGGGGGGVRQFEDELDDLIPFIRRDSIF